LLSHTSGVPDIFQVGIDKIGEGLPSLVNVYNYTSLLFTPGEKYNYSNANYMFLSYIIEKVSGKTYENFLGENIFKPMQMNQTGFAYSYSGTVMAQPYRDVFEMKKVPVSELANLKILKGAGGMYSTATDLSKFLNGMYRLLSKQSLEMMWQPVKEDYGFVWHIQEQFAKKTIKHAGGINGYSSEMRYVPADSLSVIILSNSRSNDLNIRYTAFDIMKLVNNTPVDVDMTFNDLFRQVYYA
jgi:CubicO group peptidase (beta-lactamase class C family)